MCTFVSSEQNFVKVYKKKNLVASAAVNKYIFFGSIIDLNNYIIEETHT